MISVFVHRNGRSEPATSIDRAWLNPASGVVLWVDIASPSVPESLVLSDTFGFHSLSVEDAMSALEFPKVEAYAGYLYVVLHGLAYTKGDEGFKTHDIDFFLGRNFLVTVHDGTSRSIHEIREHCPRNHNILGDGPVALFHRIVDRMVDRYLPEIEAFEEWMDEIEEAVFGAPSPDILRDILDLKRQVSALRRIAIPQRDVISRLARREFTDISSEMAYRFRDVYDHIVRLNDEAMMLQDRITGVLEAHLSNVNNRLNAVMKVLTVVATIFMPLTLLSGIWGMNIPLPHFPGGEAVQFWWVIGVMLTLAVTMLGLFRRMGWI